MWIIWLVMPILHKCVLFSHLVLTFLQNYRVLSGKEQYSRSVGEVQVRGTDTVYEQRKLWQDVLTEAVQGIFSDLSPIILLMVEASLSLQEQVLKPPWFLPVQISKYQNEKCKDEISKKSVLSIYREQARGPLWVNRGSGLTAILCLSPHPVCHW